MTPEMEIILKRLAEIQQDNAVIKQSLGIGIPEPEGISENRLQIRKDAFKRMERYRLRQLKKK